MDFDYHEKAFERLEDWLDIEDGGRSKLTE